MGYVISLSLAAYAWVRGSAITQPAGSLIAGLLWLWMWILTWGNTANPDLETYRYLYGSDQTTAGIGDGYWALVNAANAAGLEYGTFVAVTSGLAFLMLFGAVASLTRNRALPALLYFAYPFAFDAIQLRNLLMMAIVVFGFALMHLRKRTGVLLYCSSVVLAASIHPLAWVSLTLLIVRMKRGIAIAKTVAVIGFGLVGVTMIDSTPLRSILADALQWFGGDRLDVYAVEPTRWGVIAFATLQLATVALLSQAVMAAKRLPELRNDNPGSQLAQRFIYSAYAASLLVVATLPLVAVNSNFWRFSRDLWIIDAIAFALAIGLASHDQTARKLRTGLVWGLAALVIAQFCFHLLPHFDSVLRPLLEDNWIIRGVQDGQFGPRPS